MSETAMPTWSNTRQSLPLRASSTERDAGRFGLEPTAGDSRERSRRGGGPNMKARARASASQPTWRQWPTLAPQSWRGQCGVCVATGHRYPAEDSRTGA